MAMSYPEHLLGGGSYPSAEVQSVYSTAPADSAIILKKENKYVNMVFEYTIKKLNEIIILVYYYFFVKIMKK